MSGSGGFRRAGRDAIAARSRTSSNVFRLWTEAGRRGVFVPPSDLKFERARALLAAIMTSPADWPARREAFRKAGFSVTARRLNDETILVVRELDKARIGRGFYLLRLGPARPVCLAAPHGDSDLLTGKIALRLFLEHPAQALALNTLHRRHGDLARLDRTCFQAFAVAFAATYPAGAIIQLHGYERTGRKDPAVRDVHCIVAGTLPDSRIASLSACFSEAVGEKALAAPRDTQELGGTGNIQKRALQSRGFQGFAHIEMSIEMRGRLNASSRLRSRFFACLAGSGS